MLRMLKSLPWKIFQNNFQYNKDWNMTWMNNALVLFRFQNNFQYNKDWNWDLKDFRSQCADFQNNFQYNKDWNMIKHKSMVIEDELPE